jgi:hypothetical protein
LEHEKELGSDKAAEGVSMKNRRLGGQKKLNVTDPPFLPWSGRIEGGKGLDPEKFPLPLHWKALISILLGARNENAILMAVPTSPRSRL